MEINRRQDTSSHGTHDFLVCGRRARSRNNPGIIFFLIALLFMPIACLKQDSPFIDKEIGYEMTIPPQWKKMASPDKQTVLFQRIQGKTVGKATIKLSPELGNAYGTTALDFINNHLLVQVKHLYRSQNIPLTLRGEPFLEKHNDLDWARASYLIDYNDLEVIYVAQVNDYVFTFVMTSTGTDQDQDEGALRAMLDSFVMHKREKNSLF